jgi:hypothetical protein
MLWDEKLFSKASVGLCPEPVRVIDMRSRRQRLESIPNWEDGGRATELRSPSNIFMHRSSRATTAHQIRASLLHSLALMATLVQTRSRSNL